MRTGGRARRCRRVPTATSSGSGRSISSHPAAGPTARTVRSNAVHVVAHDLRRGPGARAQRHDRVADPRDLAVDAATDIDRAAISRAGTFEVDDREPPEAEFVPADGDGPLVGRHGVRALTHAPRGPRLLDPLRQHRLDRRRTRSASPSRRARTSCAPLGVWRGCWTAPPSGRQRCDVRGRIGDVDPARVRPVPGHVGWAPRLPAHLERPTARPPGRSRRRPGRRRGGGRPRRQRRSARARPPPRRPRRPRTSRSARPPAPAHDRSNVVSRRGRPPRRCSHSSPSTPTYTTPEPSASQSKHPPPIERPGRGSGDAVSIRSGPPPTSTIVTAARVPQRCTNATVRPSGERRGSVSSRPAQDQFDGNGFDRVAGMGSTGPDRS